MIFLRQNNIRLLIIGGLFFSLLPLGCRQRRAIDVPPTIEKAPGDTQINMRVLIKEADSMEVQFDGSFQAVGGGVVQTFVKRPVPVKVSVSGGSITVNNFNFGQSLRLSRPVGEFLDIDGRRYRGSLDLKLSDNNRILVVNELPVEHYLAGVVAAEMPASWEIEALKAQAVAARTYSLYVKFTSGENRFWDVKSTQADQVYKGVEAEYSRIWSVVEQTASEVLTSGTSSIAYGLLPAYFSSACGGYTVDGALVFGSDSPSLSGVRCPYCKKTAPAHYYNWPQVTISKQELFARMCEKYPNLKRLESLKTIRASRHVQKDDFYKFLRVDIIGTNGKTDWLNGDDLRFIIGASKVRSTACRIEDTGSGIRFHSGRGYGHNVGMCQYGVQAMAREGKKYREILDFYYPGAKIKGLY
jgi:stage II sporulation protein D